MWSCIPHKSAASFSTTLHQVLIDRVNDQSRHPSASITAQRLKAAKSADLPFAITAVSLCACHCAVASKNLTVCCEVTIRWRWVTQSQQPDADLANFSAWCWPPRCGIRMLDAQCTALCTPSGRWCYTMYFPSHKIQCGPMGSRRVRDGVLTLSSYDYTTMQANYGAKLYSDPDR